MKSLQWLPILIVIVFSVNLLHGQRDSDYVGKFVNFNYQNELRFEWPVGFGFWYYKDLYESMDRTKEAAKIILNNLAEIEYELQSDSPLDIRIFEYNGLTKMEINRSSNPVTYVYKESQLIFTGLHVINITRKNESPVRIYFDNTDALKQLTKINYEELEDKIIPYIREGKLLTFKELKKTKELAFRQIEDEFAMIGIFKEQKEVIYTIGSVWGAQINPAGIGIGCYPELAKVRYIVKPDGKSVLHSKTAIQSSVYIYSEFGYLSASLVHLKGGKLDKYIRGFDLAGLGIGMYYMGNDKAEQYGAQISFHGETSNTSIGFFLGLPFKNTSLFQNFSLAVGFKF